VGLDPAAWADLPPGVYAVALAVSPDGAEVALGRTDGRVEFRDRVTGTPTGELTGHPGGVLAVADGPGGGLLAPAGDGGPARGRAPPGRPGPRPSSGTASRARSAAGLPRASGRSTMWCSPRAVDTWRAPATTGRPCLTPPTTGRGWPSAGTRSTRSPFPRTPAC